MKAQRLTNVLHTFIIDPVKLITRKKSGLISFIGLLIYVLMALFGAYLVPLDTQPKPWKRYLPPSLEHPLGTDFEGKDIFSQIINGAGDVLYVAFLASTFTVVIATLLGSVSGFKGGLIDSLVMAVDEILLTIPQFPLLVVLAALIRLDNFTLALLLGALSWPALARAIRAQILSLKERDFIEAARALGLGLRHIIFVEMLPNLLPYIVVSWILSMTGAIYSQVGLVFLGFVPFRSHNWGVMINLAWTWGAIYYKDSVWYIISPIFAIIFFQLCTIYFASSLEELLNPRLREAR